MVESIAHDVKGHVAMIGSGVNGVRSIGFDIRHGERILLKATDPEVISRAESALNDGACLEIFYEDKPEGSYTGVLFHVC